MPKLSPAVERERKRRRKALRIARRAHRRDARTVRLRALQTARDALAAIRRLRRARPSRRMVSNGVGYYDGRKVAAWIIPILERAAATGKWNGHITSGFRSYQDQYYIYYVARIRPAAIPGTSNHEGAFYPRGAIDTGDPWGLRAALRQTGDNVKLKAYLDVLGPRDPWHFSATGR